MVLREEAGDDPAFVPGEVWSEGDVRVRAIAYLDFEDGLSWLEHIYVEVLPGVKMMSTLRDFELQSKDITFIEAGTAEDLQKMLDEAYYAMPLDAEENKNGGYSVRPEARVKSGTDRSGSGDPACAVLGPSQGRNR